MLKQINKSDT